MGNDTRRKGLGMVRQLILICLGLVVSVLFYPAQTAGFDTLTTPLTMQGTQQEHTVTGVVSDSQSGEVLPGVNISVEGTTTGTSTNSDGTYAITVSSEQDTLVFSFVGFQTQTIPINGRSRIDVELAPQAIVGEDVVVVGYGSQEQQDVTGSVSSVSSEQIAEVPVSDAASALQGRAAGVMVARSGSQPGDGVTVRVRGRRSLSASNDPLYIVDGIPFSGDISDINPQNIESMEVLKDASATAIYGSRGANGVILVSTSRGGNYETRVSYDGYFGVSSQLEEPDMMSGPEFAEMRREAFRAIGEYTGDSDIFTNAELEAVNNGVTYDYPDLVTDQAGYQQSHQITVQGGNKRTQFSVSGNYFNEIGIISGQDFNRYTFRINLDHEVSDRFRVGTSTLLSRFDQAYGVNPYGNALSANPLGDPYNEDGSLDFRPTDDGLATNPLSDLVPGKVLDDRERLRVFSNIFAEYDITDNLNYRINFGPDLQAYRRGVFQGTETNARGEGVPYAEKSENLLHNYTLENILNYQQTFSDTHELDITGLFSIQTEHFETDTVAASGLPYETQKYHNLGTANTAENYSSYLEEWGMMSFMGRVNYQFNNTYLFTITGRADGSSRLAEDNRWGFFPSAAIGWRITEEPFMANQDLFSDLKLRISYGVTGNTAIDPYQTQDILARSTYQFGDNPGYGYRPGQIPNKNLQWEVSRQLNVGLNYGLWDSRVTGSIEVYQTNTTDMLLQRNLPITSGFGSVFENVGETKNRGIEFTLNSQNVLDSGRDGFSWSSELTLFANREEIIDLYGNREDDVGNQWFIGEPLTVWYDYEKIGIWQESEEDEADSYGQNPGEIKVKDQNGDGIINEQDRVILGSDMPDLSGGLANHFSYKGFDLSVFLYGSFGQMIFNNFRAGNAAAIDEADGGNNTLAGRYNNIDIDYWTPDNPTNKAPRPNQSREYPLYGDTMAYQDGSFLKIRNVRLGYNLPLETVQRVGLRSLRIYINAETPLLFSKTGNIDPEQYGGVIVGDVPTTRLYTAGVNINF
ncbi:TonB-linked outer membrane protein, SusC/RagA family [Fodinibius roseus]|uniref:TonB-linked outer membrane protein, SusC/RagA family n=1 Tax=Fodinibius roseus TaxID=1194090 RepID=A0A1M4SZ22_9BACT|nr:TonB-dependent receptor [Fodinibius roseus]SHE37431.1 TonB-linked outer membrane protein, SusC/RagA family [Fodinibius roseus]